MVVVNIKRRKSTKSSVVSATTKVVASFICISAFTIGVFIGVKLFSSTESTPLILDAKSQENLSIQQTLVHALHPDRLKAIAQQHRDEYKNAFPFPHAVIDNLFPKQVLEAILDEIPESLVGDDGCYAKHERCTSRKGAENQFMKSNINDELEMGPVTREVIWFLTSGTFIHFLSELSGIVGLLPDPMHDGGGIHLTASGGKLNIHADYNAKPGASVDRRVNFFLFLNPDWDDSYGGHLELWNRDLDKCGARIKPDLGRIVVFSTTDFTYHGHPHPLTAPIGRVRRSIALYYYTVGRPKRECIDNICPTYTSDRLHVKHSHGTNWKEPLCSDCIDCFHEKGIQ
jgi:Rps23 Pro-64 3,4-dihydroxylase Tpa1-like proline 4-hydroxylase